MKHSSLATLTAILLGFAPFAGAATVVIQPTTEASSKDAKIYSGTPTSNFSSNLNVTSADIGAYFLGLVQFDLSSLSSIAAGDITHASLTLYSNGVGVSGGPALGGDVVLRPILAGWRENSGDPGTEPLATYDAFFGASPTLTFGSVIATQSISSSGFYSWDITSTVAAWRDGSLVNNGLLIQLSTNGGDIGFADADSLPGIPGSSPALSVTAVPEPATYALSSAGLVLAAGLLRRKFYRVA